MLSFHLSLGTAWLWLHCNMSRVQQQELWYNLMGRFVNHQNMITVIIILIAVGVEVLVLGDGRLQAPSALRVAVLDEARGRLSAAGVVIVAVRRGSRGRGHFVVPLYVVLEYVVGALICKGGGDR